MRDHSKSALGQVLPGSFSVLMGHEITAITEKYYCRRKQQQASMNVRNLWAGCTPDSMQKSMPDVKKPLIDENKWITGYA